MKEKLRRLRILLGALYVLFALCVCLAVLSIYLQGRAVQSQSDSLAWIFTPERIRSSLAPVLCLIPVILLLLGIHAAFVRRSRSQAMPEMAQLCPMESAQGTSSLAALRRVLFFLAFLLIVGGIINGGMRDILVKAINLCTECVGLG